MLFTSSVYFVFISLGFIIFWVCNYILKKAAYSNNRSIASIGSSRNTILNTILLILSYVFYAFTDWRFLILLVTMSFISFLGGLFLTKNTFLLSRKIILTLSVAIELSILIFFKYYNFFVTSFASAFGIENGTTLYIILPLGISFFTFQAVSYVVDAYRQQVHLRAETTFSSLIECLLYIAFFPKLLSGPIERPAHFFPQLRIDKCFSYEQGLAGLRLILWGLFKKVVVADNCAIYVNAVYADYNNFNTLTLIIAAILYSIQIYCDFSGYSDIAIGSAKLFGFNLADNFRFPYFSRNMGEFWKRWHISLNTWFVDYVYIPLGGSRNGKVRTLANTMIVFLLSGLWHGADWSFVLWGAYHGLLLLILIVLGKNTRFESVVANNSILPNVKETLQMLLVFVLATIGWIMFRADNISDFIGYIQHIYSNSYSFFSTPYIKNRFYFISTLLFIVLMFIIEWKQRREDVVLKGNLVNNKILRFGLYLLLVFLIIIYRTTNTTFVYFQF